MKKLLFLLILITVAVSVHAFSFDVDISPSEKVIRMNETAEYTLTITHDQSREVYIEMYSLDILWDFRTATQLIVPPQGLTTTLSVRPLRARDPGFYGIPLTFHSRVYGQSTKETLLVGLKPIFDVKREYTPSVRSKVDMPEQNDPRTEIPITIDVENLNKRNITHMTVHLRSNLINRDEQVSLAPLVEDQWEYYVKLDPLTRPQDDILRVSLSTEHEERTIRFDAKPVEFSIAPYGDVEEDIETSRSFLKVRQENHLTNTGNGVKTITYQVATNFFSNLFTVTEPNARAENGLFTWEVTLEPQETRTIIVSENYWPLFLALLLIILVLVGYYLFRAPVVLRKEVKVVGDKMLKISVFVRNRSPRSMDKITLSDRIPKMFEVTKEFGPGEVKPDNVVKIRSKKTHEDLGTKLQWHIVDLHGREEMVVQYHIRTRLTMVGTVTLDPITASIPAGQKKIRVKSNAASVTVGK